MITDCHEMLDKMLGMSSKKNINFLLDEQEKKKKNKGDA